MAQEPARETEATRRAVLAGVGLAGVAAVAACSSNSSNAAGSPPASSAPPSGGATSSAPGGGGTALGSASEIPVGGGKVFSAQKVVVTQPETGQFKGFSAVCTHEQCIVDQVANGTIDCPCHGSQFSIKDGSVVAGPAPSPLPAQQVTVSGGQVSLG